MKLRLLDASAERREAEVAGTARITIGRIQMNAAPMNEPRRLPSAADDHHEQDLERELMPKLDASAAPSQRNTITAPATPQ